MAIAGNYRRALQRMEIGRPLPQATYLRDLLSTAVGGPDSGFSRDSGSPGAGFTRGGGEHEPDKYRVPTGFAPSRGLFETALESPFTPLGTAGTGSPFSRDSNDGHLRSYAPFTAPAPQPKGPRNPLGDTTWLSR